MTETNFASMRAAMVESQLRTSDVSDVRVIAAMAHVPREDYVPAERRAMAYIDRPVPLGEGKALNPPLATGRLLTEAAIKTGERVLLVGAATGYAEAVLKEMGAVVTALDEQAALAGPSGAADFDVLLIDGAVETVPQGLVDALAANGRASFGLVERGVTRLCTGRKSGGAFGQATLADLEMVVLAGFARPKSFVF